MADGDLNGDDPILGPPPAPDDRLWRHPSEVGWSTTNPAPGIHRSQRARPWATVGAGALGALVVGAAWVAVDSGADIRFVTQRVATVPVETVAPLVTPAHEWSDEVSKLARPATATVQTASGTETLAGAIAVYGDGYLLTSARALDGHTDFLIHTADGTIVEAVLVGIDEATDLSVLKMAQDLDPAPMAATLPEVGDAVAFIDAGGDSVRHVVTDATAASTAVDGDHLVGIVSLDGTLGDLQPGSPVVDAEGAVIGIVAATGELAPLAVIPIDIASEIASDLITEGVVRHPRLGLTARDVQTNDDLGIAVGSFVTAVEPDGPAHLGGVAADDVIVAIEDDAIDSMAAMVATLRHYDPGELITVEVDRAGEQVWCSVELGEALP